MIICCCHNRNSEFKTKEKRDSSMKGGLSQQRIEPGSIGFSNIKVTQGKLVKYSLKGEGELK